MENTKDKKLIIGVLITVIILVVVGSVAFFIIHRNDKNDEKVNTKTDYVETIERFAAACKSEDKMRDFVNNYVDFRAVYAMRESSKPEDFIDEYNAAKESDYNDKNFIEYVQDAFRYYVSEDEEITVKEVGDLTKSDEYKDINVAKVTFLTKNEDEVKMQVLFHEGKMILLSIDISM